MDYTSDKVYCQIVKLVINSEGGYSNNVHDAGGATKFGVAFNFNRALLESMGVKEADMPNLTYDQACQIYYIKYWLPCKANEIPDLRLAYIHFDSAVNCGVGQALVFLSRLSKNPKFFEGGNKNQALWMQLVLEYMAIRLNYYTHIKNRKYFLEGWANRLVDVVHNALTMAV